MREKLRLIIYSIAGLTVGAVGLTMGADFPQVQPFMAEGGLNLYDTPSGFLSEDEFAADFDSGVYWLIQNGLEQDVPITATSSDVIAQLNEVSLIGKQGRFHYLHPRTKERVMEVVSDVEHNDVIFRRSKPLPNKRFILVGRQAEAAIAIQHTATAQTSGSKATSVSITSGLTVDTGEMVIGTCTGSGGAQTGITWNGNAMETGTNGGSSMIEIEETPDTGTNTMTCSGASEHRSLTGWVVSGQKTSATALGNTDTLDTGPLNDCDPDGLTISGSSGSAVFGVCYQNADVDCTPDAAWTEDLDTDASTANQNHCHGHDLDVASGSYTIGLTHNGNTGVEGAWIEILEAAVASVSETSRGGDISHGTVDIGQGILNVGQ